MKNSWVLAAFVMVFMLSLASSASAQLSSAGGPVDISADNLEVIDAKNLAIYIGHVDVIQDDARLQADRIEVQFAKGTSEQSGGALNASWGDIQSITAIGNVFYTTPGEVARSDRGVYKLSSDTITMTGDVVVTQAGNVIRSQALQINVRTGEASFVAGTTGRQSTDRVRSVFFPKTAEADDNEQ
ncbi:hypothetical protein MNBD_ALPHA06-993 [hydrothermal vent metagenome]|uniref:Organic solvent tolerance-like N-terminal domain-containing protein n=1 Tax=hydrothermal vent metagenome TaxID=652676 RepID=A0A3B0RR12_9ZZZZ